MSIFLHEGDARASFITIGRMPKRVGPKGGQESVVTVLVDASSAVERWAQPEARSYFLETCSRQQLWYHPSSDKDFL
jgi:hypothetical protein